MLTTQVMPSQQTRVSQRLLVELEFLVVGFDDDNGSYIKVLHDHIAYRYEIKEVIGKGSFGQVVKVCMCVHSPHNLMLDILVL